MNKIKNIFYNDNLTWKKTIIFSIICGVITGIIPLLKFLDKTSIHNIAVCYEVWVILAMYVILNSKKPLEAGLKTFAFFLISQPLCYLVQVPFYRDGFGIFMYYDYWFKLTLLTFPGAIIAWYTKKENWLSILILSVALLILNLGLFEHINMLIKSFPYQLLAVIFIILEIILLIKMIFKNKKKRIVLYIISILLFIFVSIYTTNAKNPGNTEYIACYYLKENNSYSIIEKDANINVKIEDNMLIAKSKVFGEYTIKIKDKDNNIISLSFNVTEEETSLEESADMINIKINNNEYKVILENNETVNELISKMPLELEMTELNGNEYYKYLEFNLKTNKENISNINTGDIMLYEDNCLVIFYKTFTTTYSYTKIGHIENIDNLEEDLSKGKVILTK